MSKIQISKETAKVIGVAPDKNGFYFADPNIKITLAQHHVIMAGTEIKLRQYLLREFGLMNT